MKKMLPRTTTALGALMLCISTSHAAQPYVTDDASILAPGQCQFEAGQQVNRGSREVWLLPACNLIFDAEVTIGKSRLSEDASDRSLYVLQGKGVWREYSAEQTGIGWVAGVRGHSRTAEDRRRISSYYASLLVSRAFLGERLAAHVNLGLVAERDARTEPVTWAVGAEYALDERLKVIGEFSGDDRTRAQHQVGLRLVLLPERLEFDVSMGGENGNRRATRFWTIGARFYTDPAPK